MADNISSLKEDLSALATSQQMAAANPEQSVWVEASAGTGKTKVLSDRVLRLLLAKVNPARILCLTYTKAAAVEMNERIAKRLSSWAVENEDELKKELQELLGDKFSTYNEHELLNFSRTLFATLLDTPGGMKIQTIHSFCQDVLKRFPLEAGISPYFEVMDDRRAKEILQTIRTELLRTPVSEYPEELGRSITYLTQNVSEASFPQILNMITENRTQIDILLKKYDNNVSLIIQALEKHLGISFNLSEDEIKTEVLAGIDKDMFRRATEAFTGGKTEDSNKAAAFAQVAAENFELSSYPTYKSAFFTKNNELRKRFACQYAIQRFPEILGFMAQEAQRLNEAEEKIITLGVLKSTVAVLYVAQHIIERYNEYKSIYATMDYEDLIVTARRLLENKTVADWVLFKLDGGIDHILIDEAQDTSPNQWAIVRALSQEFFAGLGSYSSALPRTVFVVGDRKQSIYSFQGADPREFDKMYHYFDEKSQNFHKIHLDVSFRSAPAIMDCVNRLFSFEAAKKGVVPADEQVNHRPYRVGEGGKVEIWPLEMPESKKEIDDSNFIPDKRITVPSVSNALAYKIASNIKNMVEGKDVLVSQNRPVRYGDFMFLVQQRDTFVEEFVRACKDLGVNVAGVDKLQLLEQIAVQDLISLGKFLLLPSDDLSLAEVLKSPLFELDDDDLLDLCYKRDSTLFNSILGNSKYANLAQDLQKLLNDAGFLRPFELFNSILIRFDGRKRFIARMGGEVEDVLDEFLNLALKFETNHTPTLEAFISWILSDKVIVKKEMEQGDSDTVKIMTAHGSKGLQAPIVILADTVRTKDKKRDCRFLWDKEDLFYFPLCSAAYDKHCNELRDDEIDADFDEYRRLLYVALTRAEDRLYIAGFSKSDKIDDGSWYNLLVNHLISNVTLPDGDKRIIYDIPQSASVKDKKTSLQKADKDFDYSYLLNPTPEESPLAKPYSPSKSDVDEEEIVASPLTEKGNFYRRGTVIHKLLQYIGSLNPSLRESAAYQFLKKYLPEFSMTEIDKIIEEVNNLCTAYPSIFSENSQAEVPIIGEVDGKIMSAKIDRLVVSPNKVVIVDYKTNRPAADTVSNVPGIYLKQLGDYKKLLQRIYPGKEVETYLLWTNTCNMMKV